MLRPTVVLPASLCQASPSELRWIFAHELCNLMVARAASPGLPVDWWANRASPFPLAASADLMRSLGFISEAEQIFVSGHESQIQYHCGGSEKTICGILPDPYELLRG